MPQGEFRYRIFERESPLHEAPTSEQLLCGVRYQPSSSKNRILALADNHADRYANIEIEVDGNVFQPVAEAQLSLKGEAGKGLVARKCLCAMRAIYS